MSGEDRSPAGDGLKDKLIESPHDFTDDPEDEWAFLKQRAIKTKADTEDELEKTFSKFEPVKFIKRDFNYVVRVDCGSQYVDLYMTGNQLMEVQSKKATDPINFRR